MSNDLTIMVGKTMTRVVSDYQEILEFVSNLGERFIFYHEQDCCEDVYIDDICGDLDDLIGSPITRAEESSNLEDGSLGESITWTFYKFATIKGSVTVTWRGESNGHYSESVDFRVEHVL